MSIPASPSGMRSAKWFGETAGRCDGCIQPARNLEIPHIFWSAGFPFANMNCRRLMARSDKWKSSLLEFSNTVFHNVSLARSGFY